ncbi:MAG: transporter [Acidobacteria bacterium]|nr:transporter [Acidobacteriota bacterium]
MSGARAGRARCAGAVLALASLGTAGPSGAVELSLAKAVETALANNPALAAVEETRRQVEGGIVEARADAFPQISFGGSWGQSLSPSLLNSPDFEDLLELFPEGFEPGTQELTRAAITVSQTIWSFGKVRAAVDLAETVAQAAEAQIAAARLDTGLAVADAYFRVLATREGLATIEADREYRKRDLERVRDLLDIGEATELELLRAEAAAAEVEPEVARRQGQVRVAENGLRNLLALSAEEPLVLEPAPAQLPDPPAGDLLVELALAERPELSDLALQVAAREQQKKVTSADGLPQLDFNGAWGREVRVIGNFSDPLYSAWAFGVNLNWSLFDGGRRKGQVAQIESQRTQTQLLLDDLRARVRLEVDQALSNYLTARARAAAAELSAGASREALRVARENYEQGVATQTDLLDAQSRSTLSEAIAIESHYEALIQASRLARAVGRPATAPWRAIAEN